MIYTYEDCIEKFHSDYGIRKELREGTLFRLEKGIYSDREQESELAVISKQYPDAVFTMNSAFYWHDLTKEIPEAYYLMTDKDAAKIRNPRIRQSFDNYDSLEIGLMIMEYDGYPIRVFNRERMLVELIRNKTKLPFDYYKEIIISYRKLIHDMDIQVVREYAEQLPKKNLVLNTIRMEVL